MNRKIFWGIVVAAYLIGIIMSLLQREPLVDEAGSNIPFTEKFMADYPYFDMNNGGPSSTPLAFIFLSAIGKVLGVNIHVFRLITALISFSGFYTFYKILDSKCGGYYPAALFLLFNPYFYRLSFTFYIGVWGILFAMLSVYFVLKSPTFTNSILAGLCLAAAVLTQQFYVFLVPALILMYYFSQESFIGDKKVLFKHISIILLPQISYLLLFIHWKGMTSPEYQNVHIISIKPQNIIYFFILAGFYFGWLVLNKSKFNKKFIFAVLALPLFVIYVPKYTGELKSGDMLTGLIMRISDALKLFNENLQLLFLLVFFVLGLILFLNGKMKDIWLLPLMFFVASMAFNTVSGERYFISVIPFLILYFLQQIEDFRKKIVYVLPVYAILAVFYLFKWFFVTE